MRTLHHLAPSRLALFLLVLSVPAVFAQVPMDGVDDPTEQALQDGTFLPEGIEATGDTMEVRALTEWAEEHWQTAPQQAERAVQRAMPLAQNLDDQRGIGYSLMILGHLASDTDQKEACYIAAHEAFEQIGDERALVSNQINMGTVYRLRGELEQALTTYFDALETLEHFGDTEGQARVLNNLGFTHQGQSNLEEALTYYARATALAETLNKPVLLTSILNNFGYCLVEYGSYEQAEIYLLRGLALSEEGDFRLFTAGISNNLGFLFNQQGRHQRALPHLFTAERVAKELGDNGLLFAVTDEIGKAYLGLERYDRAVDYANEGLKLARDTESTSQQMFAHQTLSQIYAAIGNYKQAFSHHQQYTDVKDLVFNAEKSQVIAEMQTRYETEAKQRANERLEQEVQIQSLRASRWRTWMIGGVSGLLLLLGFLYNRFRLKQRANRLLEELNTAKSRFFANISHEFRTPLTVILGGLQDALMGRFGALSPKLIEQNRVLLRNSRQLQRLIDEVLDLNRLEAGKLELQPAPGDLVRSLRQVVQADAPLAERNSIDLTFEPDAEHCLRLYDQPKVDKIVGNLLSNALKFTPRGGSVRVELRCGKKTEIAVSDTGPGIPAEMQEKIFERFAQVEDGALHGGTGIGLALVKELAELHGGTITLESAPGEGSIFTVRLPLQKGALEESEENGHESQRDVEVPPNGGRSAQQTEETDGNPDRITVLIIEDNDDVRAYVRRTLEQMYCVLEAVDGESGLQQARADLPDLIVSDVMLPGIDGYEIARRLKAEPAMECIPVVMLTARAAENDHIGGYDSGAEAYITKPFSPGALHSVIARLLEERRRLRLRLREEAKQAKDDPKKADVTLRERAQSAIRENLYDENFGVEELASSLNLTRQTLYNRFKSEVGLSPSDLLRTLRLERARELLSDGAGTVSEVAYAVGFNSRVAFSRAYSSHYGAPPSVHLRS